MLPEISSAMLVVTHGCNLECRYCFVRQGAERMSPETAWEAVEFLSRNAERSGEVPAINFFGGEPLLMWDGLIEPLVRRVRAEGRPFRFSVTTNGTLLTGERMDFMRREGFGLLLSMDGVREVQDANRPFHGGRGSFDALESVVPEVLARWPGTTLRMTAVPASCRWLFKSILWAERAGFRSFFVVPNVFESWDAAAWAELEHSVFNYADLYAARHGRGEECIRFSTFERMLRDLGPGGRERAALRRRAENKCGLGAGRFASIAPDGAIYACQELCSNGGRESPFYIGNLGEGVSEERRRELMGRYSAERSRGERGCGGCPCAELCDGGCAANNYLATGRLNILPEVYCRWMRLLLRAAERVRRDMDG